MFADSLLETSWAQRTRRSWTTATSFGLQAVVIGVLLMVPLWTTVGLPSGRTVSTPVSMGRPDPAPIATSHTIARGGGIRIIPYSGRIMAPSSVPTRVIPGDDTGLVAIGIVGDRIGDVGFPTGPPNGLQIPITGTRPIPPVLATAARAFRTSSMLEGSLIRRVQPMYPPLARNVRVQGPVVLEAVISKAGTMENLRLISGHPMLVQAALEAVSQWRYRPYILNGEPIEVETQITVNFVLAGN